MATKSLSTFERADELSREIAMSGGGIFKATKSWLKYAQLITAFARDHGRFTNHLCLQDFVSISYDLMTRAQVSTFS